MITTLNQSLAFHQSPEAFISSRLQELSTTKPESLPSTTGGAKITKASILNRQVHIISSYQICRDILNEDGGPAVDSVKATSSTAPGASLFSAGPAYRELMKDWFGEDNLLLEDSAVHSQHKDAWKRQTTSLPADLEPHLRRITRAFIESEFRPGKRIDLYETLKTLSWKLLLGAFLGLDANEDDKTYAKVEQAQETLLRGQFSLFPVSINTPFYRSARNKGLHARVQLQQLLSDRYQEQKPATCPLLQNSDVGRDDIATHCLLFTSSIANKALASLLTASIMNIFMMPGQNLASLLRAQTRESQAKILRSILLETERLSPPVVGVMRRVEEDIVLNGGTEEVHSVPKGHDVWLYFFGASRDENSFENAQAFQFDRFMAETTPQGFAFSGGSKTCLGRDIARLLVSLLAEEMLNANIELRGGLQSEGVQAWLGWKSAEGAQAFAKDLKQLPCQRPRLPVWVQVSTIEHGS
jgi:cytochrome P450